MNVEGYAAIVTGGGSGMGAETARFLANAGAKVALLDVNVAGAQAVATEIGGLALECDVSHAGREIQHKKLPRATLQTRSRGQACCIAAGCSSGHNHCKSLQR